MFVLCLPKNRGKRLATPLALSGLVFIKKEADDWSMCCVMCLVVPRVLLRVRMLYYLKAEVLGEAAAQFLEGIPARYKVHHEGTH